MQASVFSNKRLNLWNKIYLITVWYESVKQYNNTNDNKNNSQNFVSELQIYYSKEAKC
jgi:hypothetical protein